MRSPQRGRPDRRSRAPRPAVVARRATRRTCPRGRSIERNALVIEPAYRLVVVVLVVLDATFIDQLEQACDSPPLDVLFEGDGDRLPLRLELAQFLGGTDEFVIESKIRGRSCTSFA